MGLGVFTLTNMDKSHTYDLTDFPLPQHLQMNENLLIADGPSSSQPKNFLNHLTETPGLDFSYIKTEHYSKEAHDSIYTFLSSFGDTQYASSLTSPLPYKYSSYYIYDIQESSKNYSAFIYFNLTNPQSLLAFTNTLSNAFIQKALPQSTHPVTIKATLAQMTVFDELMGKVVESIQSSMFTNSFAFAFAFIPGLIASFILRERERELRHQQLISGMSLESYWIANYVFEVVILYVPEFFVFLLYTAFGLNVPDAWIALILFPPAIVAFTFVTSFIFDKEGSVFTINFFFHAIVGLFFPLTCFILRGFTATKTVAKILEIIFGFIPSFNCVSTFYFIAKYV